MRLGDAPPSKAAVPRVLASVSSYKRAFLESSWSAAHYLSCVSSLSDSSSSSQLNSNAAMSKCNAAQSKNNHDAAAPAEASPAGAAASPTVGRYSPDAAEQEIAALRAEAATLDRARRRAGGVETPVSRLRSSKLSSDLAQKVAELKAYRSEQSGVALTALAVLMILAVLWILMGWENPLAWMERINKEQRHEAMLRNRGPM